MSNFPDKILSPNLFCSIKKKIIVFKEYKQCI